MHRRLLIPLLGLLALASCHDQAAPTPTAPPSGTLAAPAPLSAAPSFAVASSALPSAAPSTAAAKGAISSLKSDSLRDMDRVRGTRLRVSGVFVKRTVARQGGPPSEHPLHTNNMVWAADQKDGTDLLRCDLGEGWAAGVEPSDRVAVEGIARFEDPSTIHNGPKELRLRGCTVEKAQ